MGGADAGFLYAETEEQPSTTGCIVELRPRPGPEGEVRPLTVDDLRSHVEARLDVLPSFRWRVERVPFGLHHPVLVDDPDLDLGHHIRHVALDDPSDAGVEAYVTGLATELLDRRHPLWRLVLVDGLHDGRQVLVLLLHHAIVDGTAFRTVLRRLLTDLDPDEAAALRAAEPFRPTPVRRRRLVVDGLRALLGSLSVLPGLLWRARRRAAAADARRAEAPVRVPRHADTPVTRLNDAFSGRRRLARRQVPLADVRRVKDAAGATVNEVVLAMAAGGVRERLAATGDLPEAALTVNVPVAVEPPHPPGTPDRQWGNHFSNYLSSLATDVADPVARLRAIGEVAREGRAQLDVLGPTTIAGLLDQLPAFVAEPGARWLAAQTRAHRTDRADHSVLLSNIRGSDERFAFTGPHGRVEVTRLTPVGITFEGTGLTLVAWTYGDTVELSALSHAEAEPDPAAVLAGMEAALAELGAALGLAEPEEAGA